MIHDELLELARQAVTMQQDFLQQEGGAHAGGASIFSDPFRLISWARYSSGLMGDPAWGPEDVIQEVMLRIVERDATALGGNPTWVTRLICNSKIFERCEVEVAAHDLPMSDLMHDIRIVLDSTELQVLELYYEQDLTQAQIADLMCTTDRDIRHTMQRARTKIKAYLYGTPLYG